jgi:hypothetical protein
MGSAVSNGVEDIIEENIASFNPLRRRGSTSRWGGFVRRGVSESIHWLTAEVHSSGLTHWRPQSA